MKLARYNHLGTRRPNHTLTILHRNADLVSATAIFLRNAPQHSEQLLFNVSYSVSFKMSCSLLNHEPSEKGIR